MFLYIAPVDKTPLMKIVIILGLAMFVLFAGIISIGQVNAQYGAPTNMPTMPSQPTQVSGKYSNQDYGVDVTLPDGWSGMEMKLPGGSAMVTAMPGGMGAAQGTTPTTMATLTIIPKNSTKTSPSTIPENMPKDEKCNPVSTSTKNINGVSFSESIIECTGITSVKIKSDVAQTDKYYVTMSYIATPSSNYDSNVANFDSALGTIHVTNAIESPAMPQSSNNSISSAIPEFPLALVSVISATLMGFAIIVAKKLQFLSF
jgi:hypothetical protein